MKKLEFSIEIDANKEKVWNALWQKDNYKNWTSLFSEGSHIVGDLVEGNTIQFLDAKNNGMFAKIVQLIPNEKIYFLHQGEIVDGLCQEATYGNDVIENYDLVETEGKTHLAFTMNVPLEYFQFFVNIFPSVLDKVKEIAEERA